MTRVHQLIDKALSGLVLAFTVVVLVFVGAMRWIGALPPVEDAAVAANQVFNPQLHVFLLAPAWFILCAIRSARDSDRQVLIRSRSRLHWLSAQISTAFIEAVQLVLPLALVGVMLAFFSGLGWTVDSVVEFSLRLSLFMLFLVATRCSFAALALLPIRFAMYVFGVFLIAIGMATASRVPLPSFLAAVSWQTWVEPVQASELVGHSYVGVAVFAAWILALHLAVGVTDRGLLGLRSVAQLWRVPGLLLALIGLEVLLIAPTSADTTAVSVWDALLTIYFGPLVDMIGVPFIPVLLALIMFFGPVLFMLHGFEQETGSWLEVVLIRAGSPAGWMSLFLTRWALVSTAALLAAPLVTVLSWALLPDASRTSSTISDTWGLLAYRYYIVGFLQVLFYLLFAFLVSWLCQRAGAGLVAVVVMMVGGIANPLFGGWLPMYLNGLARMPFGWEGATRDTAVLLAASALVIAALLTSLRLAHPFKSSRARRKTWQQSKSTV